jgi:pimeloyl-ACP methyl ester carboxylesterase
VSILVVIISLAVNLKAQNQKPLVYLIPGQGADYRLFKNLEIDTAYEIKHIHYFTPSEGMNMTDYAKALSVQIDTNRTFYLVGVSLGGMLATEMGDFLNPEKIILISSAKNRNEFPFRYRFQKTIPLYKIVPKGFVKLGAQILQPIVEPASRMEKETCSAMLKDKDKDFLKRTVTMILEWERIEYRKDIVHIHGSNDKTIPHRNVKFDYLIEGGSHMMVLIRADVIGDIINHVIDQS